MEKMRAALIGAGFTGAAHIEALRRLGYVDVVAIANKSDPEGKAKSLCVPKGYHDYMDMIDQEKLDCVHICTPNSLHFEMAMYAMERGISVICEKPLTVTMEQAEALRNYAREHHLVCAVNFSLRNNPQVNQMRNLIRSGLAGDVFTVHGSYLQDWLCYDTDWNWRLESELSGNTRAVSDIGSQWLDMVEYILGQKITSVMADFETFYKVRKKPVLQSDSDSGESEQYELRSVDTEDYCSMMFHMENGTRGGCMISQVFAGRKNQQILSISCSKCSMQWDSESSGNLWIGSRDGYNQQAAKISLTTRDESKAMISYPRSYMEGLNDTFKHNFDRIYKSIQGIASEEEREYPTFESGYRGILLSEKIYESAKKRCWIRVD